MLTPACTPTKGTVSLEGSTTGVNHSSRPEALKAE